MDSFFGYFSVKCKSDTVKQGPARTGFSDLYNRLVSFGIVEVHIFSLVSLILIRRKEELGHHYRQETQRVLPTSPSL